MQGKGVIKFFAILLAVVCLYQFSFTWVVRKVKEDAKVYAKGNAKKERAYLRFCFNTTGLPVIRAYLSI